MSKKIKKQIISPDPIYGNQKVAKLINHVLRKGKKSLARKIVYSAFSTIKDKTKKEPVEVFEKAIENVTPELEVKPKRVGGATYQVPTPVSPARGITLSLRWMVNAAKAQKGKPMHEKLSEEIMAAASGAGAAMRKKENMNRMAQANRAFAHFAR